MKQDERDRRKDRYGGATSNRGDGAHQYDMYSVVDCGVEAKKLNVRRR
jgi:hypothetical protein